MSFQKYFYDYWISPQSKNLLYKFLSFFLLFPYLTHYGFIYQLKDKSYEIFLSCYSANFVILFIR